MLIKRYEEYKLPFPFCSECKKFMRKGKEVLTDEPPREVMNE